MVKKTFYLQIIIVLLFLLASICTTPLLINHIPSDADRLCNINHWSDDASLKEDFVFFGASTAMNAIAGDTISDLYGVDAVSFTSVGQSLSESFLFYSRIHDRTKAVVQCISVSDLSSKPGINGYKVNRLIIDGYCMDSVTLMLIDKSTPMMFDKSFFEACFEVRSFVKTSIHGFLKELIQPGQNRKESVIDIKNSYLFTYERAPEEHYNKYFALISNEQVNSLILNQEKVQMINRANEYFTARGIEYYIVLLPVSSYTAKSQALDYREVLGKGDIKCDIIDCSYILDDDCFADPGHPNRKGASIVSRYVMNAISNSIAVR